MLRFSGRPVLEGSKKSSYRLTVPVAIARGIAAPCWARCSVNNSDPFVAWARRPPSRTSVEIGIPARLLPQNMGEVSATIEPAEPYRARTWTPRTGFDWLRFVDDKSDDYFPTETLEGYLLLHNRYQLPFSLKRVTELEATYRLLGWYQAEGSKSEAAPDFTFATANELALAAYALLTENVFGIPKNRLSLEILRAKDQSPEDARRDFESTGIPVCSERVRTGKGRRAAVFHVLKSLPLLRMVQKALAHIGEGNWPSEECARQYALGWLDGDGTITIIRRATMTFELRLAGHDEEQQLTMSALKHGFGWTRDANPFGGIRSHTSRILTLLEAAQLAQHGAFQFSLSRARLIWALWKRLETWKLPIYRGGRTLTTEEDAAEAQVIFNADLKDELQMLRSNPLAETNFITGIKGEIYPIKKAATF